MRVSQLLCAAGPVDAVTNQGLACRRLFQSWGWDGADYAEVIAPTMARGQILPLHDLEPRANEVLLVHYSGYAREIEAILSRPTANRSLLISHNITPARWFWELEPFEGVRCSLAPGQLAELAQRVDAVAGVSEYNAAEIRRVAGRADVSVIPVLFDRSRLGAPDSDRVGAGPPTILFVGRLAPHKRQDLVIRVFGEYLRHEPAARLRLVGVPISPAYEALMKQLADRVAPGAVTFENGIPAEALRDRYREADVFLCLSEHEGFCIPLLEAFHFGVPVVARDAGAIAEVAGDAAVLLSKDDDAATIVELLRLVIGNGELREQLRTRAERRLAVYDPDVTAAKLRDAIMGVGT